MHYDHKYGVELEAVFVKIGKNKTLIHEFLFDILSPAEYKELAVRWQIIKQLKNDVPHRNIAQNLKVSVATVTRGSRELMNKKGGFDLVWEKYYR